MRSFVPNQLVENVFGFERQFTRDETIGGKGGMVTLEKPVRYTSQQLALRDNLHCVRKVIHDSDHIAPLALKAEPAIHDAKVTGDKPLKIMAIYIVEKDKPLATPAP